MALKHLLHQLDRAHLHNEVRRIRDKWLRRLRRVDDQVLTLEPEGEVRGEVLFAYVLDGFLLRDRQAMPHGHTHFWESVAMAETYRELGYRVDVVAWKNQKFVPEKDYAAAIDVRLLLESWAEHLSSETVKVFHAETAHRSFHNPAQLRRLERLAERRGTRIAPQKLIEENRAAETADAITILGNEFTQETYAHTGKPQFRIPISVPFTYPWPHGKDFDAVRRNFLWFGSGGLVHKGLDLVLEIFAALPDFHLTVCGPVRKEKDFEREYFRELYETPNIHTHGWIDVGSPEFQELARSCLGLVYPSCSEGGGGGVLTSMHAGLVPVVTREASVDAAGGIVLENDSLTEIRGAIERLAAEPARELETRARTAWEFAREHHTRENFRRVYRGVAEKLVSGI